MEAVDSLWFQPAGIPWPYTCIGIVLAKDQFGYKAYIGLAIGDDEKVDERRIIESGCRFHKTELWPDIKSWLP